MAFFIHIADVGFPDPPWPGFRRLGPYDTLEEARAQAVSDAAGGYAVGTIYDDEGSELHDAALAENADGPTPAVSDAEIAADADEVVKALVAERLRGHQEDADALALILPKSVTVEDLKSEGLL